MFPKALELRDSFPFKAKSNTYCVSLFRTIKSSFLINLYINLACLSVCLFVSNKRQNG